MPKGNSQVSTVEVEAEARSAIDIAQNQHMRLMEMAVQSDGGVEKLEKLMALQERWEKNNAKKAFSQARAAFQSVVPVIEKKGFAEFEHRNGGGTTSYTYAKLEDIAEAIKEPLAQCGLSYWFDQSVEQTDKGIVVTVICIVEHKDGHSEKVPMSFFPDQSGKKSPIQQLASTISYLRRYTLTAALGLVVKEEDNDALPLNEHVDIECYDESLFEQNLPLWRQKIVEGINTAEQTIAYLESKGFVFSQSQINRISEP